MRAASSLGRPKLLAVASDGGHWIQLLRLSPAFEGADVVYASSRARKGGVFSGCRYYSIRDANQDTKFSLVASALQMLFIVLRERPQAVISTGAAPGYFAILFGRMVGARTIWVDSIANARQISYSGRLAQRHCTLFLTQWEDVALVEGIRFEGTVL